LLGVIALIHDLGQFGFELQDSVLLVDDSSDPRQLPTKANLMAAIHWLVNDAQPNDSLFFHCPYPSRMITAHKLNPDTDSGHGGQTRSDEGYYRDEG
jgi:metacaspase-1